MNLKPKLFAIVFIAIFGSTILLFNNCQPIGEQYLGQKSSSSSTGTPNLPGTSPDDDFDGADYFAATVKPLFESACVACHTLPLNGGTAPLTIFNYNNMKARILQGPGSTDNPLYNKVRNIVAHTGGDQCINDVGGSVSPCKELRTWAELEDPTLANGIAGLIVNADVLGKVRGWAINPQQANTPIQVNVYVNGPVGTGTLVATVLADKAGNGVQDGHYFDLQIDPAYRDGVGRDFYFYGGAAAPATLLPGMPKRITAYQQKQAGRDYFENTVRPALNQCVGCHVVDYNVQWYYLAEPTPAGGGSATSNLLINKAAGMNHSGGNRCGGGKNASPCSLLQTWWGLEFN